MVQTARWANFFGSRSGQLFILFLCVCQLLAAGIGYGFYASSVAWFKEHKSQEKITALQLVEAFVSNYAALRSQLGANAPVPATFRADAIAAFNKAHGDSSEFNLMWVGVRGREIKTPPLDDNMAAIIEAFTHEASPKAVSEVLTIGGQPVFRTVFPSPASAQACVDCHNQIQAGKTTWHLNDIMGAFAIDVPMGAFLHDSLKQSVELAGAIFVVLTTFGFLFSFYHYRKAKEAEAAQVQIADSEARFRDFAESTSDWFWEQDENLRFTRFSGSRNASQITSNKDLGKTRHETVKLGVTEEQWAAHDADLAARRPFQNFRFQRELGDGHVIHVSVSGKPVFDAKGHFRGYRGAGRDISAEVAAEVELQRRVDERTTALKAAQGELVRKERLSALGQLTATMAHELRNPLAAIRNSLFAVRETATASGINLERPLTRVDRSVERCDRIINDLLDYTRMKDLHRAVVSPDPWLDEVLADQRLPADVTVARKRGADCKISIDSERMRRVVINLVDNAAQAMTETGRERKIAISTARVGDRFELVIEDTGAGIPSEVLPRVFEPLFSTKSFGTGLGLPLVKQIVEQHGGTITISSEPGSGTRVTVRLETARQNEEIAA